MARGFTNLPIFLLLASVPGFGQIIIPGVGYPGGGNQGRYPGRYPPQQQPGNYPNDSSQNSSDTLEGILRSIGDNKVIIEADDQTITTVTTAGSTKYVGNSGSSAKMGDFQPGDHIKIEAKQDNKKVYHAKSVTLMKEGTADEHSAASLAMDDPTKPLPGRTPAPGNSSASNSSSSSNDSNRPKLRRASSSSDDDVVASNRSSSRSSSSDSDDDSDRPKLRRAGSSSDSGSSSSNSSNNSSSSSSDNSGYTPPRPRRAVSGADDGVRAEITPGDAPPPSSSTTAPRSSAPPARSSDDDVPQLRRSRPVTDSNGAIADSRPSLHADDSGGVTRLPSAPVVTGDRSSGGDRLPQRIAASGDDIIDQAREEAFSFTETLPNYVVKQFTTRYASTVARGGKTSWQALDTVTADVIEENGEEKYKNILVNGKAPRQDVEKTGSWSKGEFSSLQLDVLSPLTNADFHNKRTTTIVNRGAIRFDFSVEQPNSHWHIESEGQSYMPAYTGTIWIDKENFRVLRIELSAQNMPRSFPLDQVESAVDYDYVQIGDGKYLLPVHSEALSCAHGANNCSRNVIEFRNYKKFTADTSITFDDKP